MTAKGEIRVTLVKSPIGYNKKQKQTVRGLGLGRIGSSKVLKDTPEIRGMVNKVSHLVEVAPAD
ncbi:MAG: 50S ribosomal protein L30 [Thermodesulfobacteriota bacterium]